MKKFLVKTFVFLFIACLLLLLPFLFFKLDGYTDPFYLRFTTPRQSSLIIGTSGAAQGIQPLVLDSILKRKDIYNYAFTIAHSPYGPTYLNSIKKKLNPNTKDGIFILIVNPWDISGPAKNPDNADSFPEASRMLGQTIFVNLNPNIFYLWNSYGKSLYNLFSEGKSSGMLLHNEGWLEVTVSMDSTSVCNRIEEKLEDYSNKMLQKYKFSSLRMEYLEKTIDFLKGHGQVFLVSLPIHPQMSIIEKRLMPDFDSKIDFLAAKMKVPYENFRRAKGSYQFVDGNHLYKTSGRIVSMEIGEWINEFHKN